MRESPLREPSKRDIQSSTSRPKRHRKQNQPLNIGDMKSQVYLAPPFHYHAFFCSIQTLCCPLSVFAAKKTRDPDTLSFEEAMNDADREKWIKAAEKEIAELEAHGVWEEVDEKVARGHQIVPCTWVFRRKRAPDGTLKKWKARICLRGDLMKGYDDNFAPVVAFSTIRMFLLMSIFLEYETCSIDFSNAFVQAKRPDFLFMKVPRGFKTSKPGQTIRLLRSLYGSKDAPKLWAELLFKALRELGFKQSKIDQCLWYGKNLFLIHYVDDVAIAAKSMDLIDDLVSKLQKKGFVLTKESSFSEFLGIQYVKNQDGSFTLSQAGLIKKIIEATGLQSSKPNRLPAPREALAIDPDGEPFEDPWNYASIVGMLLYLSTNTRPDIAFAVSQVARFTHQPKKSHATAVKMIVRYLQGSIEQGTIIKKTTSLNLDVFCDADFMGLFGKDPSKEPSSAKSRSGYIIKLGGCPLIWKSQLMQSICLSTAEAEYYSLSLAIRALLPIRSLLKEMKLNIAMPANLANEALKTSIFEDNTAALSLAVDQRLTSRTRHYHCRYHFFWQIVNSTEIEINYVETKEQEADIFTKQLPVVDFEYLRKKIQGW